MLGESPHRSSSHIAEYRRLKCAQRSRCRATHYAQYGGGGLPSPSARRERFQIASNTLDLFYDVSDSRIAEDKTVLFSSLPRPLAHSPDRLPAADLRCPQLKLAPPARRRGLPSG